MIEEDSVLSMVRQTARPSFIEIGNDLEGEATEEGLQPLLSFHQDQQNRVFCGESLRLETRP